LSGIGGRKSEGRIAGQVGNGKRPNSQVAESVKRGGEGGGKTPSTRPHPGLPPQKNDKTKEGFEKNEKGVVKGKKSTDCRIKKQGAARKKKAMTRGKKFTLPSRKGGEKAKMGGKARVPKRSLRNSDR